MIEKYTLDNLTQDSVSVKKQAYTEYEGDEYPIREPWRRAYVNNNQERQQVIDELPQAQAEAIFVIWGDKPTVFPKESPL
ncbi:MULTISPECIES: hypothetical protein [Lysinibacillus]|uniref:Uncharacterized protein n=1 Tax=Lysinibacillus xylanilyticus TaxID=582475 RepID=A0ABV3VWK9_9BACI